MGLDFLNCPFPSIFNVHKFQPFLFSFVGYCNHSIVSVENGQNSFFASFEREKEESNPFAGSRYSRKGECS